MTLLEINNILPSPFICSQELAPYDGAQNEKTFLYFSLNITEKEHEQIHFICHSP